MVLRLPIDTPGEAVVGLARDIKARRLAMNETQASIAERAGVSTSTLKRLEADGSGSLKDFVSVAWTLGVRDGLTGIVKLPGPASISDVLNEAKVAHRRRASADRRPKP